MTAQDERQMHELAKKLAELTANPPWEAMRYAAIGFVMEQLAQFCAVCDCRKEKR